MQVFKIMSVKLLYKSLFFSSLLFGTTPVRYFYGFCSEVIDGDTIIVNGYHRIRLAGLDAPELDQKSFDNRSIGKMSQNFLEKKLKGKKIKVFLEGRGFYKRYLGEVFINNESINRKQVLQGYAVAYNTRFKLEEYLAKKRKRGIWKSFGFYYPKQFRRQLKLKKRKPYFNNLN